MQYSKQSFTKRERKTGAKYQTNNHLFYDFICSYKKDGPFYNIEILRQLITQTVPQYHDSIIHDYSLYMNKTIVHITKVSLVILNCHQLSTSSYWQLQKHSSYVLPMYDVCL